MSRNSLLIKLWILLFTIGIFNSTTSGSDRIDSLIQVIPKTADDSTRLRFINEVAFYYVFNDSEKALSMLNEGLKEAVQKQLVFCQNELTNTKGIYFDIAGVKDSARHYMQKSLKLSREKDFKNLEKMTLNSLGLHFWNSGGFQDALDCFSKALEINKEYFQNEKEPEANYKSNIGLIHQELKQYQKAIEYHQSALDIRDSLNLKPGQVISYANLGVCFKRLKKWAEAEEAYLKAQKLAFEVGNMRMYYSLNDNLGSLYIDIKEYQKAIDVLLKALSRPEIVGKYPKSDLSTYSNLTAAYTYQNKPQEALKYAKYGFEIVEKDSKLKVFAGTLYKHAAESHYLLGNMEDGRKLLEEFITINDSLFAQDHAQALADLEVKFKTEEKEAELAQAQAHLAQRELHIERQNLLIFGSIFAIVILLIIGSLLYRQQKLKNLQLAKEAQLAEAHSQIAAQQKLNEQRLHIARELHDNIGTYLTFMKTSLEKWQGYNDHSRERVNEVIQLMKKTATELRHTVWILNNESITLEEIILRIRDLMQFNKQDVSLSADVIGNDQLVLDNIQSTHLIRVIQEAINNSLKHSKASQIEVLLYGNEHVISFEVRDNGAGFELTPHSDGNGIINMHYRMNKLGGTLEVKGNTETGTRICGTFSLFNKLVD
ncbi:MAG: tetratricopeptide repeat protein [Marinoscillum sp.]